MAAQKTSGGKIEVDDLVVQTALAFGNGAGGVNLTPKATRLLRAFFTPRFKEHLKHYRKNRLAMLGYATGLGWFAKTHAANKGRTEIGVADITAGIDQMPCPIMPEVFELLENLRRGG